MPDTRKPKTLLNLLFTIFLLSPGLAVHAEDDPWKPPASPEGLKPSLELPELFSFPDGSRAKTKADCVRPLSYPHLRAHGTLL